MPKQRQILNLLQEQPSAGICPMCATVIYRIGDYSRTEFVKGAVVLPYRCHHCDYKGFEFHLPDGRFMFHIDQDDTHVNADIAEYKLKMGL